MLHRAAGTACSDTFDKGGNCHLYLTLNSIKVNCELIRVVVTATIARVMNYLGVISKLRACPTGVSTSCDFLLLHVVKHIV